MAEYSIKDIAMRIKNIENTRKVTKAMEIIASSKFKKLRERSDAVKPFLDGLLKCMHDIIRISGSDYSEYIKRREGKAVCYIVIAGDKGLAGGYNINIFRTFESLCKNKESAVIPIGVKSLEYFRNTDKQIISNDFNVAHKMEYSDCKRISKIVCDGYLNREFDEVNIIYTEFISSFKQTVRIKKLLPISFEDKGTADKKEYIMCEPGIEGLLNIIVPFYVSGIVWTSVCESVTSEFGARHTAMESASKNALEISENLKLKYNRLRQSEITQEITEIVAGI